MKRLLLLMMILVFVDWNALSGEEQTTGNLSGPNSPTGEKGAFFVTPFFMYTHFDNLKLVSHVNTYTLWEGESNYTYSGEEINNYNNIYQTRYSQSMTGIRAGFQAKKGLGISVYAGINHFTFYSWEGFGNTQTSSAEYPAFTSGLALDYKKAVSGNLMVLAFVSGNFCSTKSIIMSNSSGEEVIYSKLKSMFWDAALSIGYYSGKIIPYAGVGVSQQFVWNQTTEKILAEVDLGLPFYNQTNFDTYYRGLGIYGFAGIDYQASHQYSFFLRGSLPNPARITTGLRIKL